MNAVIVFILRLVLIIISYLFVGWICYIMFTDLRRRKQNSKEDNIPALTLQTELDGQLQKRQFRTPEILLGRDPASDFPLCDETISLRHCRIAFNRKHWWAEDLGSTNGTYLNGHIIEGPTVITNDDELRLGQVTLSITIN